MLNEITQFVMSLQAAKKAQQNWTELAWSEKVQRLNQLVANQATPWLEQYLAWQLEQSSGLRTAAPAGIVFIVIDSQPTSRFFWERLIPALLAGNAVYFQCSGGETQQFNLGELNGSLVHQCNLNDEDLMMALAHPAVKGVSLVSHKGYADKLAALATSNKKLQLLGQGKNTALVLPDADLQVAAAGILQAVSAYGGQSVLNIQRALVVESQLADFLKALQQNYQPQLCPIGSEFSKQRADLWQDRQLKVIAGDQQSGFVVVSQLNNCSPWQQDPFMGPLLIVNEVKYVHEMVKWTNTSYLGLGAQIWGSPEKCAKFASKLEVGQVWCNNWFETQVHPILGSKQSQFGIQDYAWNGLFYSDVKILT